MKKFLSTLAIVGAAAFTLASCNPASTTTTTSKKATETTTTGGSAASSSSSSKKTTTTEPFVPNTSTEWDHSGYDFTAITDKTIKVWVSEMDGVAATTETQVKRFLEDELGLEGFTVSVQGISEGTASSTVAQNVDDAADIYCCAQDQLANLVQKGAAVEVWEDFADSVKNRNVTTAVKAATVGETLNAYPLTADNGYVMYYNKTDLEGVDLNSLEDIIERCEELEKNFCMELENVWYSAGFFFGTGCTSNWSVDDAGEFNGVVDTFNTDAGYVALKEMYDVMSSDYFLNASGADQFSQGTKAAVVVTGPWNTTACKEALQDDYAVVKLPSFVGCDGNTYQIGSYSGCKLMCVKPQTDEAKLVLCNAIADYLTGEECSIERFNEFQWGPANKNAAHDEAVLADEALTAIAVQAEYAIPQGQIYDGWWTIGNDITKKAILTSGTEAELKEILQEYYDEINEAYKLTGYVLVGAHQGDWSNVDANSKMTEVDDDVYEFTVTFTEAMSYKGCRVVEIGKWQSDKGYSIVTDDSKALLDVDACESADNGDNNIIFAAAGTYKITYDASLGEISIVAVTE